MGCNEINELRVRNARLRNELERLKIVTDISQKTNQDNKGLIIKKDKEIEKSKADLLTLNKERQNLELNFNKEKNDYLEKIENEKKEIEKKNQALINLEQEKQKLQMQVQNNINLINNLKNDKLKLEEKVGILNGRVNELNGDIENMKTEIKEKNEHNKNLELKVENYETKEKESQAIIQKFTEDTKKKNDEIQKLKIQFSEAKNKIDSKLEIITGLTTKKLELENKVKNLEGNLIEDKQKNSDMEKELENINKLLNLEKSQKEALELEMNKYQKTIEINNFYKTFESEVMQNKALDFIKNMKNDLSKTIKNKFDDFFKNIIENEMNNDVMNISQKENFKKNFKKRSEEYYKKAIKEFSNKTKHLNILIIGKSGVGKSTLINAILKEDRAKTQIGRPCTEGINSYESKNIRLWDSRGIELKKENSLEKVLKETKDLVITNNNLGDPDQYIHCIWYCTTGQRFEEVEEESVKQLINLYDDNSLPLIIVYTLTLSKKVFNGMKEDIKERIPKYVDVLPVLAKDYELEEYTEKANGIEELVKFSIKKFKNAIDHISFSTIRNLVIHMFDESIINNCEVISKEIIHELNSINSFDEAKLFLKNALNDFHTKINGQEIKELSDFIIKSSIEKWSINCKFEIESYSNILLKDNKEKSRTLYLNELQIFKKNKNIKTDEIEDSKNQILFSNNIINEIENAINEKKNDFIIKNIIISIFQKYMDIISVVIKKNVNAVIEEAKKKIISVIQQEIENNQNFKDIFGGLNTK